MDARPSKRSPLDDKLGIRITDFNPDRMVATMPVEGNEQPFGLLHGGATCALVETIGSWAAALCTPAPASRSSASSSTPATCGRRPPAR